MFILAFSGFSKAEVNSKYTDSNPKNQEHLKNVLLMPDIYSAADKVRQTVKVALTQYQFDALVSYVYHVGFLGPKLIEKLNRADYEGAANEINVNKINGKFSQELEDQRINERKLFSFGDYGTKN